MKNPVTKSPEILTRFDALPAEARAALKDFCSWLYRHARDEAERSWASSKAPMAVYWKAVAAWAYHISRAIN
ncbi:MAG: hypothetical protein KatS3mg051_2100 [Anaerolineae bacterium]|nr:MAG: hypothetical protein KatS3mg051_2100 [Anaerolineae bacterium]